jgi:hypothetical protein
MLWADVLHLVALIVCGAARGASVAAYFLAKLNVSDAWAPAVAVDAGCCCKIWVSVALAGHKFESIPRRPQSCFHTIPSSCLPGPF